MPRSMTPYPRVLWAGDAALTVEFGEVIDPQINDRVLAFARRVERGRMAGVVEVVPTYRSATVYVDPLACDATGLAGRLETMARRRLPAGVRAGARVDIPVLYGGAFGPDLPDMASRTGLSQRAIVELHRSVEYRVYMLGFSPGFPYLGTVPEPIAFPRLAEPRARVPAGSVGIAGSQTGVYPQESPGGWRLIGRTPLRLYDATRIRPFLLAPGDRVRFVPIARAEYERLAGRGT